MESKIKETIEKLSIGTITRDEANKILLDLYFVSNSLHFKKGAKVMREVYLKQGSGGNDLPSNDC